MDEQRSTRRTKGEATPWYADGLRFSCQPGCGECCTNHDGYAYVYLGADDIRRLSRHLRITREEFERRYTSLDEGYPILRMDEPDCPFLDGTRCTVYPARPRQCRTFPFWGENLRNRASWERLSRFCPGINRGRKHSLLTIQRQLPLRESG